jgi:ketosteroid isomerase-like protein
MDNIQIVKEVTEAFCDNRLDQQVLDKYFAPDFSHIANGRKTGLREYSEHLQRYMRDYQRFRIPAWDELFAVDDRVVAAYTLEGEKASGPTDRVNVMAVWRLKDGKIASLREVDAAMAA